MRCTEPHLGLRYVVCFALTSAFIFSTLPYDPTLATVPRELRSSLMCRDERVSVVAAAVVARIVIIASRTGDSDRTAP